MAGKHSEKKEDEKLKTNWKSQLIKILQALVVPVLIIAIWQIGGTHGWIKTSAISTPASIWDKMIDLIQKGTLQHNILISIRRVILGYLVGSFFGIILGVLLGALRKVNAYLKLLLDLLRPVPVIVWVPVLILWIGIGENTKVIVIAIGTFWPVFLNVVDGVTNVNKKYLEVATIFVKDKSETIFQVVIPAALPYLITGLRIASGNALMGVIVAEMFASSSGIGYMVNFAREMNQPSMMMVGVLVIAILGALLNTFIQKYNQKGQKQE